SSVRHKSRAIFHLRDYFPHFRGQVAYVHPYPYTEGSEPPTRLPNWAHNRSDGMPGQLPCSIPIPTCTPLPERKFLPTPEWVHGKPVNAHYPAHFHRW